MRSKPIVPTILADSSFANPERSGCLSGIVDADRADIVCNDCNVLVRRLPDTELEKRFTEMELSLKDATERCSHCASVSILFGFSKVIAFSCCTCEKPFRLPGNHD
jgi:hypothetical protein